MSALAELDTAPQTIEPTVNYLVNDGTEVFTYTGGPGSLDVRSGGKQDPHKVVMHNGRPHVNEFKLDVGGFRFVRHETKVQNFLDEAEIKRVYYPEMEALIKAESGAKRVVVFDHTLRTADDALREQQKIREVVRRAHNDYTERSGPQRVRDLFPGPEAEALLGHRFAVINVWKPIRGRVEESPLGVCDARTIGPGDLVPTDLRYRDRVGEVYSMRFNPAHRWFYYSHMGAAEAMLLKCFDSDAARARFTAHTAFDDPTSAPDAPARESIEVRTLAFFAADERG